MVVGSIYCFLFGVFIFNFNFRFVFLFFFEVKNGFIVYVEKREIWEYLILIVGFEIGNYILVDEYKLIW